jgi:hypothetical protein
MRAVGRNGCATFSHPQIYGPAMTRPSHFLNSSSLKGRVPTKTSTQSLQDQLLETRLRIERAKLAKIEAEIPDKDPKYTVGRICRPQPQKMKRGFMRDFGN